MSAKINPRVLMAKKHSVFVPMLVLMPWFAGAPSLARVVFVVLFIPYYFVALMAPVYIMRYFIRVMHLSQKAVNLVFGVGLALECSLLAHGLAGAFVLGTTPVESAMFLVPLTVFFRTAAAMAALVMVFSLVGYGREPEED